MEKLFILVVFIILVGFAGCKTSQSKSEPSTDSSSVNANIETEFRVNGMHCTGCENTIKTNVKDIKGVATVEASFKENKAVVGYDSLLTNEAAIISAINDAGYKVDTFIRK